MSIVCPNYNYRRSHCCHALVAGAIESPECGVWPAYVMLRPAPMKLMSRVTTSIAALLPCARIQIHCQVQNSKIPVPVPSISSAVDSIIPSTKTRISSPSCMMRRDISHASSDATPRCSSANPSGRPFWAGSGSLSAPNHASWISFRTVFFQFFSVCSPFFLLQLGGSRETGARAE